MFNTKKFIISSTITLGAISLVYAGIIGSIHADQIRNADKTVVVSDEEFREIVIQHQITPALTPYPDFDLVHLSNIKLIKEKADEDYRGEGNQEYSADSEGIKEVESDDESDSGVAEDESNLNDGGYSDDSESVWESVPELVESGTNDFITESGAEEYSAGDEGNAGDISPVQVEGTGLTYLGDWTITAYCPCEFCCGQYSSGYTASGTLATAGRTIACNSLPMGTQVMIDGNIYTVEDTGWSPYGESWIDIFFNSHDEALAYGMQTREVYLVG